MNYLDLEESELKTLGALETAKEISGQPELWIDIFKKLVIERERISSFMNQALDSVTKIILTGAGTSAYIGYSVEGAMQRNTGLTTVSVATTHLVSHPQDYFQPEIPTLLISFARSGDSPESVAAVQLADKFCDNCYHLIVTCNEAGNLASFDYKSESLVCLLPPDANDKGLAMTGSYTGMLLVALLLSEIDHITEMEKTVETLTNYAEVLLSKKLDVIRNVASGKFKRAVFLGSGPQYGTAMESHLKLQELTDGSIICKNDSYLGFRHGPKAVVNEETLLVYFFSNSENVLRYELDLVNDMANGKKPLKQIGVATQKLDVPSIDELIVLGQPGQLYKVKEEYLAVVTILLGQLIGFYKSLDLGLQPDSPSTTGAISRIVQGVKIY